MKKAHHLIFIALVFGLVHAKPPQGNDDKDRRRKFGSSLKTLKWDAAKRRTVDREDDSSRGSRGASDNRSEDPIKLERPFVTFDVTVFDRSASRMVAGLKKEDFLILEGGRPQPVSMFTPANDPGGARSIILVIDYSQSINAYFDLSIRAARKLIEQLPPGDTISVVTDDVQLLSGPTSDKKTTIEALDRLGARFRDHYRGQSRQYSALFAALRELVTSRHQRTIVIFQTDGDEAAKLRDSATAGAYGASPEFGFRDVEIAAEKAGVTIYGVIPGERIVGLPDAELGKIAERARSRARDVGRNTPFKDSWIELILPGQTTIEHIAALTGGKTWYLADPGRGPRIISEMLADMNHRYFLEYYPSALSPNGQRHLVEIQIRDHPDYEVRGRLAYYAPTRPPSPSTKR